MIDNAFDGETHSGGELSEISISEYLETSHAVARWREAIDADDLGHHSLDEDVGKM